jgi:hypothetical protein
VVGALAGENTEDEDGHGVFVLGVGESHPPVANTQAPFVLGTEDPLPQRHSSGHDPLVPPAGFEPAIFTLKG